jgi:hypothetical protein
LKVRKSVINSIKAWLSQWKVVRSLRLGFYYHNFSAWVFIIIRRVPYKKLYPNFLIIWAQKSGTTSLHFYLKQHPSIFMSAFKETNLMLEDNDKVGPYYEIEPLSYGCSNRKKRREMSDHQILRRMLEGYRGQPMIGDASPLYTFSPTSGDDSPEKAFRINPGMKFVYIVRHPLERIASNYDHDRRVFDALGMPMEQSLDEWSASHRHLLDASTYARQLRPYRKLFPQKNFHVVLLENLAKDPECELRRITNFLGVSSVFKFDLKSLYRASPVPLPTEEKVSLGHPRITSNLYDQIIETVLKDVVELEEIIGCSTGWDLSREYSCTDDD